MAQTMTPENAERSEILQVRHLRIGIMGATGSGKTTYANILRDRCGFCVPEENFPENPYLEGFYRDPVKYCFDSEKFFLEAKVEQLAKVEDSLVGVVDPDIEMDGIFARTQRQMGWMSYNQYCAYSELYVEAKKKVKRPDIYFAVIAPPDVVKERIKIRGREFEKWLFEDAERLRYIDLLCKNTEEWMWKKMREPGFPPVERIRSGSYYFAQGEEEECGLVEDTLNVIHYNFLDQRSYKTRIPGTVIIPGVKRERGQEVLVNYVVRNGEIVGEKADLETRT